MVDLQWLIGGEAGYGIMTVGAMMAKIFTRLGLSVFDYVEYPSLIRGGHNAYYVRTSDTEIFSQRRGVNILVALNRETIEKHKNELLENAAVIFDPDVTSVEPSDFNKNVILVPVPLLKLTKQVGADRLMINTVAVGASLALFYSDYQVLQDILQDAFGKKGQEVVLENVNTSKAGFEYVQKKFQGKFAIQVKKNPARNANASVAGGPQENLLISGSEAVALGAIRAGLKFAAIYPMTPINNVLVVLAENAEKYSIIVKEPEDEISGINMALGASFAGVRSMVATSGGGFALMVESLGLSAQTETPIVIIEGMRPGPATSLPTWTEQGDVRFVLHGPQGDFPRIVVAPGDPLEAFSDTMHAFNVAEEYQLPVIVLVDKYLMEGHTTVGMSNFKSQMSNFKLERGKLLRDEDLVNETDYKRYLFTDDGVSPRSLPGQKGGIALSGSDEHDERGLYNESSENRVKMMDKRFRKLDAAMSDIPAPQFYGEKEADLTIIAFGSTKMPVLEAMRVLGGQGYKISFLQVSYLSPFPREEVAKAIKNAKKILVIEGNKTGQFEGLIREHTGLTIDSHFRKYDGRPFYPEEIVEEVKSVLTDRMAPGE